MGPIVEIVRGISQVGGSKISHEQDASVFLVRGLDRAVLIDAGAGRGSEIIWSRHPLRGAFRDLPFPSRGPAVHRALPAAKQPLGILIARGRLAAPARPGMVPAPIRGGVSRTALA